jgi:hypothetical protein
MIVWLRFSETKDRILAIAEAEDKSRAEIASVHVSAINDKETWDSWTDCLKGWIMRRMAASAGLPVDAVNVSPVLLPWIDPPRQNEDIIEEAPH